ncbi:DUF2243 domain-containing protein [Acidiferrimicrobium sp. IK]|uniref:DUF2243 domain-containing protein n=1 Tax=Acidiferrimicrobium sp. IK TaxID=2871700 RepID=UPI0039679EF4
MSTVGDSRAVELTWRSRPVGSGALVGVGAAAFLDETLFHQILHWHHFWDGGSQSAGLVSDGLFHLAGTLCLVSGLFLFADLRRRGTFNRPLWWAGFCFGNGGFELYDGIVQHKILHLHQIRYHVTLWPYDVTWNVIAAIILIVGFVLYRRAVRAPSGRQAGDLHR